MDTTNEPVAWMLADKKAEHIRSIMAVQHDFVPEGCVEIPLYTHPVKELTDAEIKEAKRDALKEYYSVLSYQDEFELSWIDELFARAILRKASEK